MTPPAKPTVLLIGLGDLGRAGLDLLAREPAIGRIAVASRNAGRGIARCNLARLAAIALGFAPVIEFHELDLNDASAVGELVHRISPDLIFSTATMQTWWLADLLPRDAAAPLKKARFGVWLPVHLTLTLKLMRALREADYRGVTLTAPFPDVVNCILGKLEIAPTCGVGNLDELVPKIASLAAEQLKAPLSAVRVVLVAHHALEAAAFGGPMSELPPYFLHVYHAGRDVTDIVRAKELLFAPYPMPAGAEWSTLTAASTVPLIRALLTDGETFLHAPAPHGLPGGYPIVVRRGDVQVAPIEGLTLAEAIGINERSHRFDGIERIESDGTAVFCAEDVDALRRTLGYDCPLLAPADSEESAKELMARFREYAARFGVSLERLA